MNTKTSLKISMGVVSALLMAACGNTRFDSSSSDNGTTTLGSTSQAQIKVSLAVYDNTNAMIYSDGVASSSLVLKAGQNYNLVLKPTQELSGAAYSLVLTQTSAVSPVSKTIALQSGSNNFSVPSQGDYSLKLVTTAPSMLALTKYYTADVTCANPTLTADSLDASKISVSGSNNMFSLSASGIAAGANGTGPYTCAWDGTGVSIIDTAFGSCDAAVSGFYNNLVGTRQVAVVVKDACNSVASVSKSVNYSYTVPAIGSGNTFIFGQVSSAKGSAVGDARVDNVSYFALSVKNGNHNIVTPVYSGSTFTISAAQNYGMASSVSYGMSIQLSGITGSIDYTNLSSSLSAANAKIKSVVYSTDQAGDSKGAVSFTGSSCTLSNQNLKALVTSGQPCTSGQTGTGAQATVEVWGNYTCTLSNSTGSIVVTGSFDGLENLADSCTGGGGGGGGVATPSF